MRVLVWQWGRLGSGPRFAAMLADGLRGSRDVEVLLSLSRQAEIMCGPDAPHCDLAVQTYRGLGGFLLRAALAPWLIWRLVPRLRDLRVDLAICAHPGPLDLVMGHALRHLRIPFVVIVHDADAHPGDGVPLLMALQRRLCRMATAVAALTGHVGERLKQQGLAGTDGGRLVRLFMPPMRFGAAAPRPADGPLRLLFFGRLLPYKGIDLLVDALAVLGPRPDIQVRVVGSGPESAELARLRACPGVQVENRWVPEEELPALLNWAHALVLPYREASQSGVAAAGLAAGCAIIATNVGGLVEQLGGRDGVTLCPPDPHPIAAAIATMACQRPHGMSLTVDADRAWREMGASLLDQARACAGRSA